MGIKELVGGAPLVVVLMSAVAAGCGKGTCDATNQRTGVGTLAKSAACEPNLKILMTGPATDATTKTELAVGTVGSGESKKFTFQIENKGDGFAPNFSLVATTDNPGVRISENNCLASNFPGLSSCTFTLEMDTGKASKPYEATDLKFDLQAAYSIEGKVTLAKFPVTAKFSNCTTTEVATNCGTPATPESSNYYWIYARNTYPWAVRFDLSKKSLVKSITLALRAVSLPMTISGVNIHLHDDCGAAPCITTSPTSATGVAGRKQPFMETSAGDITLTTANTLTLTSGATGYYGKAVEFMFEKPVELEQGSYWFVVNAVANTQQYGLATTGNTTSCTGAWFAEGDNGSATWYKGYNGIHFAVNRCITGT